MSDIIDDLFFKHGCHSVNIEVSKEWSNKQQKYLDKLQFQVFTNRNPSFATPAPTVMKAIENAKNDWRELDRQRKKEQSNAE